MLHKSGIDVERIVELEAIFSPAIICKVKKDNMEPIIFGVMYRSPNCLPDDNVKLNTLLENVVENFSGYDLFLTGDFNYPEICWPEDTCKKSIEHAAKVFHNAIHHLDLNQCVKENTHYRAMQNPTLIDLILTNSAESVSDISHHPPLGLSHHDILLFKIFYEPSGSTQPEVPIMKHKLAKANFEEMRKYMSEQPWEDMLSEELSVDSAWSVIKTQLTLAMDKHIPKMKVSNKPRNRKKSIPSTLLEKIREKRRTFKVYKKNRTQANYNKYARARNQVKWMSRKHEKLNEVKIAKEAKTNPKSFYQYVSSNIKPKESVANLMDSDGNMTRSNEDKANVLNKFFSSVFTQESTDSVPNFNPRTDCTLSEVTVSVDQFKKALKSLNTSKSPGPDQIHPKVLSELSNELAEPLCILFKKCMAAGRIPSEWKEAEVKPLFKKGDKTSPGNYRPVSLTPITCKIFEGFIRNALNKHLSENNLLSESQYGFTAGRSCVTQLLSTTKDWACSIDDNIPVDAIYLDFQKAFDTVPHFRLIKKLEGYGIKGNLLHWITDFLSNRSQYVNVSGSVSSKSPVTSGVPQGSVLGPTLFIYYINDMPECVKSSIKIFADDTKIYSPLHSDDDKTVLQESLNNLVKWTEDWLLRFNGQKCHVVHLGKNNPNHDYTIEDSAGVIHNLSVSEAEKDLGVYIDPLLDFDKHVNEVVKKASKISGLVSRVIKNKSDTIMVLLFKALIRPILEYANCVWSPRLRKHIDLIESIQRKFTKRIIGLGDLEYEERLRKLRLPSLEYRRLRGDMIEVYKITHDFYDPPTVATLLTPFSENTTRGHNFKLTKFNFNTSLFRSFFTNRIINFWNDLPPAVVNASSLNAFKNGLDKYFTNTTYKTNI